MADRIDTVSGRKRLAPRRSPYWMAIPDIDGAYIGFRRGPDTWICRLRDPEKPGGQRYHALGRSEDHRTAIRAAKDWMTAHEQGVVNHAATVGDACRAYLSNLEREKGAKAAQDARGRLQRRILGRTADEARAARARSLDAHPLSRKSLAKLRAVDIEEWRDELVPVDLTGEPRRKARASANREMTALIAALNHAYKRQMVSSDFAWSSISKFGDVQARNHRRYVKLDERKRLLKAAANVGNGSVGHLLEGLMLTGARPIELARTCVSDYDATTGALSLISYKGNSREPRIRELPLRALRAEGLIKRLCKDKLPAAPIFTRDDGKPWSHSDWDDLVRKARDSAKLNAITAYDLRHSFITESLTGGVDPLTVAKLVGTSLAMISMTYGKLLEDHATRAFKNVQLL
jgi:integrase